MKQIGETRKVKASNAWGHDHTAIHTTYELEATDVGRTHDNYLGHGRPGHAFTKEHIGRQIIVMTDGTGWTCWSYSA